MIVIHCLPFTSDATSTLLMHAMCNYSLIHSTVYSFINFFILLFIHSFINSFIRRTEPGCSVLGNNGLKTKFDIDLKRPAGAPGSCGVKYNPVGQPIQMFSIKIMVDLVSYSVTERFI